MSLGNSLKYLSRALPESGRAFSLRTSFNQSLVKSLKYLLGACDEVIPSHLFLKALQKLDSLNPESKLSGLLGIIHTDLFNAVERENIQRVNYIADRLIKDDFLIKNLIFINFLDFSDYYSSLAKIIFAQERIKNVKFLPLSAQKYNRAKISIQNGLKILNSTFPDFFVEFQELVGEIVILQAQELKQGSSFEHFGMIYKSSLFRSEKITDALDFLIHEQSHLYLFLLNKDNPIVLNSQEKHKSPLREEERPLIGVYHAVFVLARVYYVLKNALDLSLIPENEKDYSKELLADYKNRFNLGLEILQTHAKMTPLGEGLILSASKLV